MWLGSSTIRAANASAQHTAVGEALHMRLRGVRSEVLRGLGEGAGGPAAPLGPCCLLWAGHQVQAMGRVKGIRVALGH